MNCKPGDLAIVIKADEPSDIGLVVEVIGNGLRDWEGDWQWLCRHREAQKVFHSESGLEEARKEFHVPDFWLRPISGVPVEDEQHDEVPA